MDTPSIRALTSGGTSVTVVSKDGRVVGDSDVVGVVGFLVDSGATAVVIVVDRSSEEDGTRRSSPAQAVNATDPIRIAAPIRQCRERCTVATMPEMGRSGEPARRWRALAGWDRFVLALSTLAVVPLMGACGADAPEITGHPYSDYAHENEPFAEALFNEHATLNAREDSDLVYVNEDQTRAFTHIEDGIRRSYKAGKPGPTVWFFGGSTTFGLGQRDEHTVPSEVARIADAEGTPVEVVNFGVSAHASWQQTILIERMLGKHPPPDLIVVYHGLNDLALICQQMALGVTPDGVGKELWEARPDDPEGDCMATPDETARRLAEVTDRTMAEAREIAGGIPVIEFWQPFAATRRPTPSDGPLIEKLEVGEDLHDQDGPYQAALERRSEPPINLTDAMDSTDEPVYFDWAHHNERGARLVARAMWDRSLQQAVEGLLSAGP